MQRAIKRTRQDDFWALSAMKRGLPRETRDYVPMILAAMIIARNPAQYGFELTTTEPAPRETVTMDGPVDLRRIAEWTEHAGRRHPAAQSRAAPLDDAGARIELRVEGAGRHCRAAAREARRFAGRHRRVAELAHRESRGETLTTIARKLRVSRTDLAEANYLSAQDARPPGQKLIVPRPPTTLHGGAAGSADARARDAPLVARASLISTANGSDDQGEQLEAARRTYRVKRGDTLSSIARLFSTTVSALKQWNRLRSNHISPGQRLTVYTSSN